MWPKRLEQPKHTTKPGDFYFDIDYSTIEARLLAFAAASDSWSDLEAMFNETVKRRCQSAPIKEEKENQMKPTQSYNFTTDLDKIDLGRILRENPDALIVEVAYKRPDRKHENVIALGTKKYREECRRAGIKPSGIWCHFNDELEYVLTKNSRRYFVVSSVSIDSVSTARETVRRTVKRALDALTKAKKKRTKVTVNTF